MQDRSSMKMNDESMVGSEQFKDHSEAEIKDAKEDNFKTIVTDAQFSNILENCHSEDLP